MLVLICDSCQHSKKPLKGVVCEVCSSAVRTENRGSHQKLRILCLHGFRQSSKSFLGRTCALRKRLKAIAEFVFIDGPHELEFFPQPHVNPNDKTNLGKDKCDTSIEECSSWLSMNGIVGSLETQQTDFHAAQSLKLLEQGHQMGSCAASQQVTKPMRPKRAWLIPPKGEDNTFDEMQYMSQTLGWMESFESLRYALLDLGPFDGILGFSQGASVAAALCALKQAGKIPQDSFQFAVIASGYVSPVDEHRELLSLIGKIQVPSLHIFSVSGDDRQIGVEASKDLLSKFDRTTSCCVRHNLGHIIPSTKSYVEEYKAFLSQYC